MRERFGEAWDRLFAPAVAHRGLWGKQGAGAKCKQRRDERRAGTYLTTKNETENARRTRH